MNFFLIILYFFVCIFDLKADTKITIVLSNSNSLLIKGALGFQSSFLEDTEVILLDEFNSQEKLQSFFLNYESKNFPLIITFGHEATSSALKYLEKTPIVFSFINNSRDYFRLNKKLCGIEMKSNPSEILKTLKEIKPDTEKILSFYSSNISSFLLQEFEYYDLSQSLFLNKFKVDDFEELKTILDSEVDKNDAILLISDPLIDPKVFNYLSKIAQKKRKILISPLSSLVDMGSTFAISTDSIHLGEELGRFANTVLSKEIDCKNGPIAFPKLQFLYINNEYTEQSGIKIPEKLSRKQESDKYSMMGIELYYRKMYISSKAIFEFVKNNYPENPIYKEYLENLSIILSKEKMESMMKEAENSQKSNNFKKAAEIYRNLLKIFPNSQIITEKLNDSYFKESEDKRLEAKKLSSLKRNFEAIKKLNESLKVYSRNIQTKVDLENLKNEERKFYPENFQNAVNFYNKRFYDKAISIFNDLLLIEPNDLKVQEYIRLSKLKNDSLIKLQKCKNNPDETCGIVK